MEKILHRAADRGGGEHGWLSTRYSFSFADWYEPRRMGFGALRVLNDDRIAPGKGFGAHGHRDMEIITIVTKGAVAHKDNAGGMGIVRAGEAQTMSAGTGIVHEEFNASDAEELALFQLWIETAKPGAAPRYAERPFGPEDAQDGYTLIAGPDGSGALPIHQDAFVGVLRLEAGGSHEYQVRKEGNGVYAFAMDGAAEAEGALLGNRDALGVTGADRVRFLASVPVSLLIIEVPVSARGR